jgi:hypothetical protein
MEKRRNSNGCFERERGAENPIGGCGEEGFGERSLKRRLSSCGRAKTHAESNPHGVVHGPRCN